MKIEVHIVWADCESVRADVIHAQLSRLPNKRHASIELTEYQVAAFGPRTAALSRGKPIYEEPTECWIEVIHDED
jgi:hypothetical protein